MKRYSLRVLCLVFAVCVFAGCDNTSTEDTTPPELISEEAFSIEMSLFSAASKMASSGKAHFTAATLRVLPVSLILGAHLVIPSAVTGSALQAEPELIDGAWVWASSTETEDKTVTFTLTARPSVAEVNWSMQVGLIDPASQQTLEAFELYTAQTDLAGKKGAWQLYYRIEGDDRMVLTAEFEVVSETDKIIAFSVPETAERHGGDTVNYEQTDDTFTFIWTQVAESLEHEVIWTVDQAGSITATNYNDGETGCWDANHEDVEC